MQREALAVLKAVDSHWQKPIAVLEQLISPEQMVVHWLASSHDSTQRLAINIATLKNRRQLELCMLYLERYRMSDATTIHDSNTTLILVAEEVKREKRVALKLMAGTTVLHFAVEMVSRKHLCQVRIGAK